jgi:2-amino-4-hydroxy-6-hydroxymethyldihydropteridine diphosphokinase
MDSEAGCPAQTVRAAIERLENVGGMIRATSRLFRTPAFPPGSGPDYVNAALVVEADWSAEAALAQLHDVEAHLGRTRSVRWGQRLIDLDLLAMGDAVRPDAATVRAWMDLPLVGQQSQVPDQLILPHPRLHERPFVLVPLADVAPEWIHPILKMSVAQMMQALPAQDLAQIVPLA